MKNAILLLLVACCLGCTKKRSEIVDCPAQPCTFIFASVTVQFKDKDGSVVAVKDFAAVNQRTKETMSPKEQVINGAGYYTIVDDGSLRKLSTEGDDIVVTAKHPTTNQIKTTSYKISGGCNCHVEKLSGPEVVTF